MQVRCEYTAPNGEVHAVTASDREDLFCQLYKLYAENDLQGSHGSWVVDTVISVKRTVRFSRGSHETAESNRDRWRFKSELHDTVRDTWDDLERAWVVRMPKNEMAERLHVAIRVLRELTSSTVLGNYQVASDTKRARELSAKAYQRLTAEWSR